MAKSKTAALFEQFNDNPEPKVKPTRAKRDVVKNTNQLDFWSMPAVDIPEPFVHGARVPNLFPTVSAPYRIAIIGEAPGEDEEKQGIPFIGMSGRFLDQVLSQNSIARSACFIGNVCQFRPPGNDINAFPLTGMEIQSGLKQLKADLTKFKPHICILLGKTALWAAKGTWNIFDWRGSLFMSDRLLEAGNEFLPPQVKCIATFHPAYCLRQYDGTPLFMFDIRKAKAESLTPLLKLPNRNLQPYVPFDELIKLLDQILKDKPPLGFDIEGGVNSMSCISIATSPDNSFLLPFAKMDGGNYWESLDQEVELWSRLADILADPLIPKVLQSGLYDRFVLQHSYGLLVRNAKDDIMLKTWELYCELEKSLAFQCSIFTNEPFYKQDRKSDDEKTFFEYCCRDSAVTVEINNKLTPCLDVNQKDHYQKNMVTLNPLLYMELRGIKYNTPLAEQRLAEMKNHVYGYQEKLDQIAREVGGFECLNFNQPPSALLREIQSHCCYVRDQSKPKAEFAERGYWEVEAFLQKEPAELTPEDRGLISTMAKMTMNTKSKKFKDFLYSVCGLPTQYKKDPKTKEMKVTTDYEALLKLSKSHSHPALLISLELSRLRTRAQMLAIVPYNNRMHCSYNLVGSETGRVTSSKSIIPYKGKKVGANMQTVPDDWDLEDSEHPLTQGMRDLLLADEGKYLAKCDLKGADGWTVGAYMAMLGDPTMLDDLKFGLKPAQVVAYILKHGANSIRGKDRNELKEMCKEIKKDDWEYFVSKQGIWGTCYTMGPRKLAERVFIESEGKVNLSEKEARDFQSSIFVRYRVKIWHDWMQRFLSSQTYPAKLVAPNGMVRRFFGRKTEVLGEALAHLPQVVTTYATNTAAYKLWTDPENRIEPRLGRTGNALRVEPMHQVHDELLVQFKIEDTQWAINKIKQWFDTPMIIANQKITIPFDGAYGTNWSMGEGAKVGEIK